MPSKSMVQEQGQNITKDNIGFGYKLFLADKTYSEKIYDKQPEKFIELTKEHMVR